MRNKFLLLGLLGLVLWGTAFGQERLSDAEIEKIKDAADYAFAYGQYLRMAELINKVAWEWNLRLKEANERNNALDLRLKEANEHNCDRNTTAAATAARARATCARAARRY